MEAGWTWDFIRVDRNVGGMVIDTRNPTTTTSTTTHLQQLTRSRRRRGDSEGTQKGGKEVGERERKGWMKPEITKIDLGVRGWGGKKWWEQTRQLRLSPVR